VLTVTAIRLLPVVLVTAAAGFWFNAVEAGGPHVVANLAPLAVLALLSTVTLWRGGGRWTGAGWRWPLGTLGYAVPALGLGVYLHFAFEVNLNGMFGDPPSSGQLFRYLPLYTTVAGGIGFAIGWIAGKNL
jgi:hypothetical protein